VNFWYKYFVYISLAFLAIALYNANYLKIPHIFSLSSLLNSFIFLFAGFIVHTISWRYLLKQFNYHIQLKESLAGIGLSIFGKYIPGKIWMVMGRASYIAGRNKLPFGTLSALSLNAQFITLWIGLVFGLIGLFVLGSFRIWGWLILCLLLGLTTVIFSNMVNRWVERLIRIFLRKAIMLPHLTINSTLSVMPWFAVYWLLWSTGFYMLATSLIPMEISWSVALGFPLATTLGIISLIAPGGLGAREGVIIGYLTLANIPVIEATTIAVAARLWFLMGEIFIFIVGCVAHKRLNKQDKSVSFSLTTNSPSKEGG
jgi:glycosyltransferase 2 family protein